VRVDISTATEPEGAVSCELRMVIGSVGRPNLVMALTRKSATALGRLPRQRWQQMQLRAGLPGPALDLIATAVSPHWAQGTSMVRSSVIRRPLRISVTPQPPFQSATGLSPLAD
jgi:hypothetical protein